MPRRYWTNEITTLKPNQVFVFGSNMFGFHGAGAAGLAFRGTRENNWRGDEQFLNAMRAPAGSPRRKGNWAVFGVSRGFQEGYNGKSYAIQTVLKPGMRRSVSLPAIFEQFLLLGAHSRIHKEYEYLMRILDSGFNGYTYDEIAGLYKEWDGTASPPNNVIYPGVYKNV